MELLNRQVPNLNNIFTNDHIPNNNVVKVDNPGGGECLYTSLVNFIRIEFIVKKHLYKRGRGAVDKKIYLPYLISATNKIHEDGETLLDEGRYLRLMVCRWLKMHGDDIYGETGKKIKEFIFDPDEDDAFINIFLTKDEKDTLSLDKKYKKYIKYMARPASYGGVCEIYALGHLLKRNIKLYKQGFGEYRYSGVGYYLDEYVELPIIGIYHVVSENHYKSLYPKKIGECEIKSMVKN